MDAYVVGNLVGRLVLSYLVVWCVMLAFVHDWRIAVGRTRRSYGLVFMLVLFCIGLAAAD